MAKPQTEITHARVLKIAVPIVLSNATVPILGAVDTGVVGQMGTAAPIGAVGLGAVILATLYFIFGFLRMGTTGLVAQARGAGDVAETGALLMRGVLLAAAAGLSFILLQKLLFWGRFSFGTQQRRGRRTGARLSANPHLGRPRHHRALCGDRLVDRG
jgi:MATE family multidrug resistance protein